MKRLFEDHRALAVILAAFMLIGATYSVVTPIFEAGDEIWHYPFVQYLASGHSLPIQDPAQKTLWEQEGGQPPLYYALAALATFWIDTRDLPERLWLNPHARIGIPLLYGNKNLIVHTSAEDFPWHTTALAVHLLRFLSLLMSAATVALTYFLALEIQSPHPPLLRGDKGGIAAIAAAFVAFNPMFLFISASVNNDNLAVMLATLALLLLMRLVTQGATIRRFVLLGIVLGLAALSKVSNVGLFGVAAIVFIVPLRANFAKQSPTWDQGIASSRKPLLAMTRGIISCAALVLAISGWWYVRNYLLYGDPLAFNVWVAIAGGRPSPATLASLAAEFQGFRISFWGNFGGVNIIAPEWVYSVLDAITLLAAIGLVIGIMRRTLPRLLLLPAFWLALISVSLVRWTFLTLASQGRLIFPAIGAVAILMAYGLEQFQISNFRFQIASWRNRNFEFRISNLLFIHLSHLHLRAVQVFVTFLLAFALLTPFTLIAPVYTLPARMGTDATIPNPTRIVYENQAELIGYTLPSKSVAPGAELPITIYWRARETMAEDLSVYIHLIDANEVKVGQWDAFPGNGLYPTRLWRPGEIITDNYRVPIAFDARGPSAARVEVGLYRRAPLSALTARDPQGRAITPMLARVKIAGKSNVMIENPVRHEFADKIALVGYSAPSQIRPGDELRVRLYWRALLSMSEDYTVFVHLVDANGKLIAQQDNQPQRGEYPTSLWDAGETVGDEYALAIPRDASPGEYRIEIGIYRAGDGARLLLRSGEDHVMMATVRVVN